MTEPQESEGLSLEQQIQQLRTENAKFKEVNTRLIEENARLRESRGHFALLAGKDTLTGAKNRRRYNEDTERVHRESTREGAESALLLLDLDLFKEINDKYGHAAGDEILQAVAALLENGLHRPGDSAYRMGGDEFVVLLPKTPKANAVYVATLLQKSINELEFVVNGERVPIFTSFGVNSYKPQRAGQSAKGASLYTTDSAGTFIGADQALYTAKVHRNKVGFIYQNDRERLEIEEFLRARQIDISKVVPTLAQPISGHTPPS